MEIKSFLGKPVNEVQKTYEEHHLAITDTNGDGIFDENDRLDYAVQEGDSLFKIANKFDGYKLKDIQDANPQLNGSSLIHPKDSINIPLILDKDKADKTPSVEPPKAENPKTSDNQTKEEVIPAGIKSKKVEDTRVKHILAGETVSSLKSSGYFVVDSNKNGIFDEEEDLHKQITIMLDAGHGRANDTERRDPGAVPPKEIGEHDEAYFTGVARDELRTLLEEKGFKVVNNVRTNKAHIAERQKYKIQRSPDAFISLHCDGNDNETANGETVLYNPASPEDKKFAECVNDELKADSTFKNRALQPRKNLCVLKGDSKETISEILVEMGFVTNKDDYDKLDDETTRKQQLEAIARGVEKYYTK